MSVITEIREGDIFRWRYLNETKDTSYHCKSQIMVVRDGHLFDTYWGIDWEYSWPVAAAEGTFILTYVGNFEGLTKVPEYWDDYYDAKDIVNLNHANCSRGNFYIRNGAERSREKMLRVAESKWENAIRERRWAEKRASELSKVITAMHSGADLKTIWF